MRPEDVNHKKFQVKEILFNNNQFSIAYGLYEEEATPKIGMRWNGEGNDVGYPKLFEYPVWFMIDHYLTIPLLKMLLDVNKEKSDSLLTLLTEQISLRNK